MTFLEPSVLLLGAAIVLLIVLAWWEYARRRRRLAGFLGGERATRRLSRRNLYRPQLERLALLGFAALALAAAAAGPHWRERANPPPTPSVVLAIDVSASMQATDVVPTRLASAVDLATQLINGLPEARIGLILFAGDSYPVAPPTHDHAALLYFLSGVVPTIASEHDPGSLPSVGIRDASALWRASEDENEVRTIVLIGDGEAGESEGDVLVSVREVVSRGIRVATLGLGSSRGSEMVMPPAPYQMGGPVLDASGAPAVSRLDPASLQRIADAGLGLFVPGDDDGAAEALGAWLSPSRAAPWWQRYDVVYLLSLAALAALLVESLLDVRLPGWHQAEKRGAT